MNSTAELIHTISYLLLAPDGAQYEAQIYGCERSDRTWEGWLEFHPKDDQRPVLKTKQETSQPNRATLEYWAGGLELIYLQGALQRAQERIEGIPRPTPTDRLRPPDFTGRA